MQGKNNNGHSTVRFNERTADSNDTEVSYKPIPSELRRVISGSLPILRANVMLEGEKVEVLEIVERYRSWKLIGIVGVVASILLGLATVGALGLLMLLVLQQQV
ncbi:hypothetical protein JCM19000A_26850 [Silvimonas sp. JCM 19000]